METVRKKVVAGVCFNSEKKMLCVYSKGAWYHPGGRLEEGETEQECLVRELSEELGIQIHRDELRYYTTLEGETHGKSIPISLAFYFFEYRDNITHFNEIDQLAWLTTKEIRDGRPITSLMSKITDKLENEGYF